jgi:glycosyltransferase involved in cell wall biosynthesis
MNNLAVLIPCYNEEKTIAKVVQDFKTQLPEADIYVYDNNSEDSTVEEARKAGAIVRHERRQGKANVIRSMLSEIDADIYIMVDGDDTYPADRVKELLRPVEEGTADMTMGSRLHKDAISEFKYLNRLGNKFYLFMLHLIFRVRLTDVLTGYRAFNRKVASLPLLSQGFDIEMELTIKTIESHFRILVEVPVNLIPRPEGSESKIRVVRDGFIILNALFSIMRDYKPLTAFGLLGIVIVLIGCVPGIIVINEFIATRFIATRVVARIPLAVLSVGTILSGLFVIFSGIMLHTTSRRFQELQQQVQRILSKQHVKR